MSPYYEQDGIVIYHGRAEAVLPFVGSADLLATDPPYGIGEARKNNASRGKLVVAKDYGRSDWDDQPPPRWLLEQAIGMTRHQIIFGGNFFGLPASSCWLVWDKDNGSATLLIASWHGRTFRRRFVGSGSAGPGCCRSTWAMRKSRDSTRPRSRWR